MKDSFGREITNIRISVTDRCNLKCFYCMPGGIGEFAPKSELLSLDEILRVARAAARLGIRNFRVTGGEPFVRPGLIEFLGRLRKIPGVESLAVTTNAVLLKGKTDSLIRAGVEGMNLSLDTFERDRFTSITGSDCFDKVMRGIEEAMDAPFKTIKLNMVAMRGINDDEIPRFVQLTRNRNVHVRFIEYMPHGDWSEEEVAKKISCEEILEGIAALHPFEGDEGPRGYGPARYYRIQGWKGTFGVISPVFNPFCERCNRIRLTSRGMIKSCLLIEQYLDLKPILRGGGTDDDLVGAIRRAIVEKPERHTFQRNFSMNAIGG
ncbi:MAG: GTP 3',8-cyclase MoaA [Planctomycetota bacterium]|nr:GTP 3',8-cyclase MoaA [Planctomycetota bacterium]